jgi:hypothetical protein
MSITLELPELSPELARQLAALPEEERGYFAASLMEKGLNGSLPDSVAADEEDIMIGPPPTLGPIPVSPQSMAKIIALSQAPARVPGEGLKKALENHRRLSGEV